MDEPQQNLSETFVTFAVRSSLVDSSLA